MKTIKIAGAGIAGLICAIGLRKSGHEVTVFEKRKTIGKQFNGDFQGIENWSEKGDFSESIRYLGIELEDISIVGKRVTVIGPKEKVYRLKSKKPIFYLVKRGKEKDTLDNYLYEIAKDKGVRFHFDLPIQDLSQVHVMATGPNPSSSIIIAVGMTFKTDLDDGVYIHVDTDYNKTGYQYLVSINQTATLASMGLKGELLGKTSVENGLFIFQKIIGKFKIKDVKHFGGYGVHSQIKLSSSKIYLGESAGLQDHFLGFGMRYAIKSAIFAVKSIEFSQENNYISNYNLMVKRHISPSVRKTIFWRKVFYNLSGNSGIKLLCNVSQFNLRAVLRYLYS